MHAFLCAAAGLTLSLGAVSAANAGVRADAANRVSGAVQFQMMEGLTGYTSARNWAGTRDVIAGETFGAAVLAQNSGSAFFIDDDPDLFQFGFGQQNGGNNLITGAETTVITSQVGNVVTVAAFTRDSSDWLPSGVDPGGAGDPLTEIRFDVGGFAAPDSISYPGFSAADVVSVDYVVFIDGTAVLTTSAVATDFSTGLAAVGIVGAANGAGVDEVQMIFNLNVPTPGAASVFGLAGLAAVRRRRR